MTPALTSAEFLDTPTWLGIFFAPVARLVIGIVSGPGLKAGPRSAPLPHRPVGEED